MTKLINIARGVIQTEIEGLDYMASRLGAEFEVAIKSIIQSEGRVIICGMGKSGIIGKKISASFASTGTPSFFMHPGEAYHGDLGMVKPEDVFIAISNSGETDEVLKLLPFLRDNGNFIIAITGCKTSTLARNSNCHLDVTVPKEACPHQLAPTTSTTATLVMGDALTVALMDDRDFKAENFARFHPGGSLGRRLLSTVKNEMIENVPTVHSDSNFSTVVQKISNGYLGLVVTTINDTVAIITDGDLRRAMEKYGKCIFDISAKDIAAINPIMININDNLSAAFELMDKQHINSLLVEDNNNVVGVLKK